MAHTVVGKLNKAASVFQAGESTGFGIRLGVKYYDRETKSDQWTNYEAAIFAKAPAQVQFYQQALVEGSVVEVSGDSIKVKTFEGQNGTQITLEINNAKLGYVHTGQQPQNFGQQQGYNQPQQQGYNQPQQQQYAQQNNAQYNQGGQGGFAPQQGGYNQHGQATTPHQF